MIVVSNTSPICYLLLINQRKLIKMSQSVETNFSYKTLKLISRRCNSVEIQRQG